MLKALTTAVIPRRQGVGHARIDAVDQPLDVDKMHEIVNRGQAVFSKAAKMLVTRLYMLDACRLLVLRSDVCQAQQHVQCRRAAVFTLSDNFFTTVAITSKSEEITQLESDPQSIERCWAHILNTCVLSPVTILLVVL